MAGATVSGHSGSLSVAELQARMAGTLDLVWRGSETGADRQLGGVGAGGQPIAMVGYLNAIHPSQVQIIGAAEAVWLQEAAPEQIDHLRVRITAGQTALVIATDGCSLDPTLAEALHSAGIAVLGTRLPAHKVAYHLRHFLSRALARQITIHGVFLEILSLGVLITGQPAVGKSELALELINRGHRLVADDAPEFALLGPDDLNGGCPPLLQDFLEVRGLGILNIRAMFGEAAIKRRKQLGLIIHLVRPEGGGHPVTNRLTGSRRQRDILEVTIPEITLPVAVGHNLAVLVEAACRDHLLRMQGYRSDEVFAQHQQDRVANQSEGA